MSAADFDYVNTKTSNNNIFDRSVKSLKYFFLSSLIIF